MTNGSEQTLQVRPGLYVLRYICSSDARSAPVARVRPSPDSATAIDLVGAPGHNAEDMGAPGSNLVIVARQPGTIEISIRALEGSSNLEANFSLDLLAPAVADAIRPQLVDLAARGREKPDAGPAPAAVSLEMTAHVSRRGDVRPDTEGWIAGPKAPSAIEGFAIVCRGAAVAVAAQYLNAAEPQRWSAWLTPGEFVGTRQKAAPLTGLRLRLVGADTDRYEMTGEALFLGSPKTVQKGSELEFAPIGGTDPMVGLRLSIVERPRPVSMDEPRGAAHEPAPAVTPSRIRVFR